MERIQRNWGISVPIPELEWIGIEKTFLKRGIRIDLKNWRNLLIPLSLPFRKLEAIPKLITWSGFPYLFFAIFIYFATLLIMLQISFHPLNYKMCAYSKICRQIPKLLKLKITKYAYLLQNLIQHSLTLVTMIHWAN